MTRRAAAPHGTAQRQADPVLQGRQLQPHPAAKVLYVLTLRANSQLISSCTQRQRLASCGGPSSWWHSFGFQSLLRGKMSFPRADQVLRGPRSVFPALGLVGETEITTQQALLPQGRGRFLPAEPKALQRPSLAAHPVAAGRDDRPRGQVIADCRYRQH